MGVACGAFAPRVGGAAPPCGCIVGEGEAGEEEAGEGKGER